MICIEAMDTMSLEDISRSEKVNIRSDVKLEKVLDMMLQEVEGMENIEDCPLCLWMNAF